jgi:hypothetical protein
MAFLDMASTRAGHRLMNTVKVYRKHGTNGFDIVVSRDIYQKLGNPAYFHIMVGSGEHSGFAALLPRGGKTGASLKVNIPTSAVGAVKVAASGNKLGVVTDKIAKPVALPFEVKDEGLIVDLRGIRPVVVPNFGTNSSVAAAA